MDQKQPEALQHFDRVKLRAAAKLRGTVRVPPDKSISHRAIFLSALAEGASQITNLLEGVDIWDSIASLRALGVNIAHEHDGRAVVHGIGSGRLVESQDVLNAGTSAATLRFLLGMVAPEPITTIITGAERTRRRPMKRIVEPLRNMGATIIGCEDGNLAPLAIRGGALRGVDYFDEFASGEVKTGLLLAGLRASSGRTQITSVMASRDHTERMLRAMGAPLRIEDDGKRVSLEPLSSPLKPLDIRVPGEISAAVYWIVLGLVHADSELLIESVCVNPTRTGLLDVLKKMGADLEIIPRGESGLEPVADIRVRSSVLKGTVVGPEMYPRMVDEFPGFALAAALAEGTTVIHGAGDLRNKKSNRISNVVREYSKLGAKVQETDDGMVFEGVAYLSGASCDSHGDHRLANSLAVAGLVASGETIVSDVAPVTRNSYPGFWEEVFRILGPDVVLS